MSIFSKVLDATKQAVGSASASIKDNAPDALGRITSVMKDGLGSARDTAKAGMEAVGASTVVSRASNAVSGVVEQVKDSTVDSLNKLTAKMERATIKIDQTTAKIKQDAASKLSNLNKTDKDT